MLIFHKNGDTIKVTNPVTNDITLTFPAVSCTVATEKDLDNITMVAGSINKPSIVSPLNNEVDFKNAFELTPYATNENFSGLQTHVTIEVSRDNSFTDLVVSQKLPITTNIVNLSIDLSLTKVYLRMKYHSNDYTSIWSDAVSFTTPEFYVIKPIILGPTGTSVSLIPYLSTNNFSYVGVSDTHESTTYQVATDSNFANIVYNITTTIDKTGHIVLEDLDYETTYYLRVRHTGTKYGNSVWSDTVMFKTIIVDEKIKVIDGQIQKLIPDKNDKFFYAIGWNSLTNNDITQAIIYKLDRDMNVISNKIYNKDNKQVIFYGACVDNDNNLVIVGANSERNTFKSSFIVKVDSNLNMISKKIITSSNSQTDSFGDIIFEESTNTYLVTGHIFTDGTQTIPATFHTGIIRFNKSLAVVENKFISTPNKIRAGTLILKSIGNDNYLGRIIMVTADSKYYSLFLIFNKNLEVIKKKIIYINNASNVTSGLFVLNGFIYSTGYIKLNGDTYLSGMILKMDMDFNIVNSKILAIYNNEIALSYATENPKKNTFLVHGRIGLPYKQIIREYDENLNLVKSLNSKNLNSVAISEGLNSIVKDNAYFINGVTYNNTVRNEVYCSITKLDTNLNDFVDWTEVTNKWEIKNTTETINVVPLTSTSEDPTIGYYNFTLSSYDSTVVEVTSTITNVTYDI